MGIAIKFDTLWFDIFSGFAEDEQIPVWGVVAASEMADHPPGSRPTDLLPGARSLIGFGIPVPRGVYQAPSHTLETVWRTQNLYYRRLETISLRIATLLEESGATALPIFGCMPVDVNERGTVVGYFNQIRLAELAGIGVIGKNGLLLNARYGSRLMLGAVLTTAELPTMRYPETEEPGCPPDCQICVRACQVNAILPEKKQVRVMRCLSYTARTPAMSRLKFVYLRASNPQKAARYMSLNAFDEHTFHICSQCVALCPYGEDK